MTRDPQPEYVWDFGRERHPGRVWLIVGLSALAVAIAVAVFVLFFRPDAVSNPAPSTSASASAMPSETPTPSLTPTSTPSARPTSVPTPPPPTSPDLATFRDTVAPVLESAETGLGYARDEGGMAAMQDIMLLQQDAQRLADTVAPSSIADRWTNAVGTYAAALEALRTAYERAEDAASEDRAAESALSELNSIVGR